MHIHGVNIMLKYFMLIFGLFYYFFALFFCIFLAFGCLLITLTFFLLFSYAKMHD